MTIIGTIFSWIAAGAERFYSAGAVAVAVENGARPKPADLRALGIDPRAFATVGRG